mmetsp:Transcript_2399/g.5220  ORF Transcript_2399/g.5220 Transcript_2399/m.5220 type:complete len:107 (+) Transcript_2399:58-378(+)
METKGAPAFNLADLRAGAKKLHSVEESSGDKKAQGKTVADEGEEAVLKAYIDLYNKFGGDIDRIFDELGENPGKAKKYPPKSAEDFATRYYAGGFTYADERRAEAK